MNNENTKYKAIFTDLDGTLLNSQKTITPKTLEALKQCSARGIALVLSSSRNLEGIEHIPKKYGIDCYISALGGGLIVDKDRKIIFEKGMTARTAQSVVTFIESKLPFVTWNIFTAREWIVKNTSDPRVIREQNIVKAYAKNGRATDIDCGVSVDKMLCMCSPSDTKRTAEVLSKEFGDLAVVQSSDILIEINPKGVNKGLGVKKICEHLGIDLSQTIAFGDNFNDFEMLKTAGLAFAMENAPDEFKQNFEHIAPSNDSNGIYKILCGLGPCRL